MEVSAANGGAVLANMSDVAQTDFIYCCGAITELLRCGPKHLRPQHKLMILLIPGNPGVLGFYRTFLVTLWSLLGKQHPVWAVSHAGHCVAPASMDMVQDASSTGVQDVFGLDGQIEHKVTFLRQYVPKDTKLVLVGHSIGCYIILEILKRDPSLQVVKAVLLFPTIERMAQTPQGKAMTPFLCHLRYMAYLPIFLLSLLPEALKRSLVRLVLGGLGCPDQSVVQAAVGLLSGDCAANAVYMGGQEMRKVLERENLTIKENLEKLLFYYGATDPWCPLQFYQEIRAHFPAGDFRLCENGFRHAFVVDAGRQVAEMVARWVEPDVRRT